MNRSRIITMVAVVAFIMLALHHIGLESRMAAATKRIEFLERTDIALGMVATNHQLRIKQLEPAGL